MLVPMRAILETADQFNYAQGSFNVNAVAQAKAAIAVHAHDLIPVLLMGGLFLGKDDDAFVVFEAFQKDLDLVPHFDFLVFKLGNGNSAFGLVADVHQNDLGTDFLDGSGNDGTFTQFAELAVNKFRQFSCAHLNG